MSGRADPTQGHRTTTAPQSFDLNIPANRAKLEAVGAPSELAIEAGLPLTHLATAFVRSHPAVTSVIIGPRTPEQLDDLLAGADVVLGNDLLDRIDEIVPPGIRAQSRGQLPGIFARSCGSAAAPAHLAASRQAHSRR